MQSSTTRQIVVAGALGAIAIVLGATRLGFIPFVLGMAITIMHVPVIIGAVMEGPLVGLAIGLLFGLFSLIWAFIGPTGPGDVFFQNPLISVVPRIFIGLVACLVYRLVREPKIWKSVLVLALVLLLAAAGPLLAYTTPVLGDQAGQKTLVLVSSLLLGALAAAGLVLVLLRVGEVPAAAAAAVAGTLTNTVLVLTSIGVVGRLGVVSKLGQVPVLPWSALAAVGLTNGIPEIIAAVLITVAVVAAWKQIEFGRKGARVFRTES